MIARLSASSNRLLITFVVLGLLAGACRDDATTVADDRIVPTVAVPTVAGQPSPTLPPATVAPTPAENAIEEPAPTSTPAESSQQGGWASDLFVGACFNSVGASDARSGTVEGPLDCGRAHQHEIFALVEVDAGQAEPYPDDADFIDEILATTCDAETVRWAGAARDSLPVTIGLWRPSASQWEAGDRAVACVAQAGVPGENPFKVGTAAGGTLTTDEGIIARATVAGQRDFFFSVQGGGVYPITNGEFELLNTSPHVSAAGITFAAPPRGDEAGVAEAFTYSFGTDTITPLSLGIDPDWQIAGPQFVTQSRSYVFAARQNESDDWDIYRSVAGSDAIPLITDDSNDRWPTVTPDGQRVVFSSNDDIWIMDIDGGNQQRVTSDDEGEYESAVSPDGSQIAYSSNRSGNDDIWLMNLDGSGQRNLTNHPANEAWPFWSADGNRIYFQTDRLGVRANIMVMEADGSNHSYYSAEFMTNAALLSDVQTERLEIATGSG